MFGKVAGACNTHPEKEAGSVSWTDWLNAASTPAPKQKWFNESGSLEPHQNEDVNSYVQASAMMISAQTVPVSGNLKAWFTRGGEHHGSRQTIRCYQSIFP